MYNMEEIYQNYAKQIYRYILYLSHNIELAEELTQETFYQAVKSIHKFRGDCEIEIWLYKIAKNLYYKYLTKNRKNGPNIEEIEMIIAVERNRRRFY